MSSNLTKRTLNWSHDSMQISQHVVALYMYIHVHVYTCIHVHVIPYLNFLKIEEIRKLSSFHIAEILFQKGKVETKLD